MGRNLSLARLAAGAGAVDTALFMAGRPHLFREKPRRALSNVALLGGWCALAATAGGERSRGAMTLAPLMAASSGAMLAAHLARRVVKPRVFVAPALAAVALADLLRRR